MNINNYKKYLSAETMMGPNSVRVLEELFEKYPLQLSSDDLLLDLGCGKGLTGLVIAKETGARVYANDLWISAEENEKRFDEWGIGGQVIPVCEDANHLNFEEKKFNALVSIDSYHYFVGHQRFFGEKILPFIKDGGAVYIGAFINNCAIGYVLLSLENKEDVMSYTNQEKCAEMIDLLIIEPLRNYGIGFRLALACEEYCREIAIPYLGLDINPTDNSAAKRLYERLGYREVGELHLDGVYECTDEHGNQGQYEDWCIDMIKRI